MIFWLSIFGVAIAALYYYLTCNFDYWRKQGIPSPSDTKILLGDLPSGLTRKQHTFYDFEKIYNEFKGKTPFVGIIQTRSPRLIILEPQLVKDVLIRKFNAFRNNEFTDFPDMQKDPLFAKNPFILKDEEWKEKRAEITPAFTSSRLKALYPLAQDVLDRLIDYVHRKESTLELRELGIKYTVDVVSNAIYGIDAQAFEIEKPLIWEMGRKLLEPTFMFNLQIFLKTSFPFLKDIIKADLSPKEAQIFFTNLLKQAVEYREKNNVRREDFLDYVIGLKKKKNISDIDMASHTISFLTDGIDTSSIAIAHAIYELAKNKRAQDKLRDEIENLFDENGKVSYDQLSNCEYLECVFFEALRLHAPAVVTSRKAEEDVTLEFGGKKVNVPKGMNVYIPIQSIHNDAEHYVEPLTFYPERFEGDGLKSYRDRCLLLPFGDGPRMCLGMRFALMQSKLAVAGLVRNFEMTVNSKTQDNPLVIDPKEMVNVKVGGLWVDFKPIRQ